ncbi:hypothetical protein SAMN05428950_103402 [Sphingomonas sp. OV641]|uniref:hypothetical protein n=1 Tax=Sphingomonas sp. OV641 TaxID=1881068 RepID=UPI0008CC4B47|nr:hypothetical protein [Sphingomonas sp. OV641]SEJ83452.1 hypothetical protein SAMN05428950_103402 [Sphingomonas sp. OV641]
MTKIAVLLVAAATMSGCAQGLPGLRPLSYATPGEARVFVSGDPCIHEPAGQESAGLLATIATTAVSALLDSFGNTLNKAAEGGNLPTAVATKNLTLLPGEIPACITFVRGSFTARKGGKIVDLGSRLWQPGDPLAAEKKARLDSLFVPAVYRLDQFVQLRLVEAPGRRALTYFPTFVLIDQSLDESKRGSRDLTVSLKFTKPGVPEAGGAVLIPDRKIGEGEIFDLDSRTGRPRYEAPWFTFPNAIANPTGATDKSNGAAKPKDTRQAAGTGGMIGGAGIGGVGADVPGGTIPPQPGTQKVDPYSKSATAVPITVSITSVEARPSKPGLAFAASVFNGAKPAINSAIAPLISSDAADTLEVAELSLNADYATSLGAARAALINYCDGVSKDNTVAGRADRIAKSSGARAAQFKANGAAIKIGVSQPFAAIVEISDEIRDKAALPACAA